VITVDQMYEAAHYLARTQANLCALFAQGIPSGKQMFTLFLSYRGVMKFVATVIHTPGTKGARLTQPYLAIS
tara:strand:+ start:398 stop:613 length:216 start_codon:yes stop_codon:yes gene_type:complete